MKTLYLSATAITSAVFAISTASAQDEDNSGGFTQDVIIVTATKKSQNIQDVPIAVTALTGEALEIRDITDLTGVTRFAPNVKFGISGTSSGSGSAAVAFIRGVGQLDFTLVTDPGVGIYVDDVYLSRTIGSVLDLVNLDRIEVLRGPQGTLFGRNSTGGAISLYTKAPGNEFGGTGRFIIGDDNRYEVSGLINVPLGENIRTSLGGYYKHRDGTAFDASDRELGDDNVYSLRFKSVWDASEVLSFAFSADYTEENEGSSAEVPLVRAADGSVDEEATVIDFTGATAAQGDSGTELETYGLSLVGNLELSETLSVKSITAYRELDALFNRTPFPSPLFSTSDPYEHTQFSQEVQLNGSFGAVDLVTGFFYLKETGENREIVDVGVSPSFPRVIGPSDLENRNWALYGEATINLTSAFRVIGGVRYTDESKEVSLISETIPGVTRNGASITSIGFSNPQELSFDQTTYRGIAQYDLADTAQVYASYSTGFKSGGFNQRLFAGPVVFDEPDVFGPEEVDSIELGLKFQNDVLRANIALFRSDYTEIQISGAPPGAIATETFNGGEARIQGVELEVNWTPIPSLLFDFSTGYQDAKYTDIAAASGLDISLDDELVYTPEWTAAFGASYLHNLGKHGDLRARMDVFTTTDLHYEPDNSIASFEDGYTTLDLSLSYLNRSNLILTAGLNNVTDARYIISGDANAGLGYDLGIFARPRNFYFSISKDF